jgi:N-acetylmuramoyl-L-alanine amidase
MILSRDIFIKILCLITFLILATSTVHANQLKSVRAWPSPDNTRVVLDLSSKPHYDIQYLKKPNRLVIDIKSTSSSVNLKKISHKGPLVKNLRESASNSKGTFRLVVDLKQASKARIFTLPPAKPYGHRLVIDLPHKASIKVPSSKNTQTITQSNIKGRDVIIAIDAGHGGEDPGALGKFSYEKNITLQIAKRLQKRINQQPGMSGFLIRTGDYYVNLNKRSELAFKGKADFLVSIHADGFTSSQPSGASVWILSDRRANSELGRRMERHEVHSELLGGKGESSDNASSVPFLNKVFFDMSKANSMQVGSDVGSLVVNELKQITKLHKKKPVGASLAVLKSPYIPSILVEAGFITNHREERLLNQAEYQNKVATAVFKGIYRHFRQSPPHDSAFAQKRRVIKHTVRSGESLSILAKRYSVSSHELKSHNRLKSNILSIGQVLKIPSNYQLVVKHDSTPVVPVQKAILSEVKVHKVQRGDSLSVIAARYGSTTSELRKYNKLRSSSLAIGQKLKIPPQVIRQTANAKPIVYKVRAGDSLSMIANRYGSTTSELKNYNQLRSTSLVIGQKLKIPNSGSGITQIPIKVPVKIVKPIIHRVKSGESLSVIANRYGKTVSDLKGYNKLRSTSIAVGQKIKIPSSGNDVAKEEIVAPVMIVKPIIHRVKSGESLSVIAKRYSKTISELKGYNKLRSTSLAVGQKIKIPNSTYEVAKEAVKTPAKVAKPIIHKVKSGESLSGIAKRYGKSINELKGYNKLRSTSLLIGQKIKIPTKAYITPIKNKPTKPTKATLHKVSSGESLSVIAAHYGTSSSVLKKHNNLRSTTLSVGQKIKIPAGVSKLTTHKVRRGESLSVIAKRYGTTASKIKSMNKLRSSSLAIGQLLTIPTT